MANITGTGSDDTLTGTTGDDTINGLGGDDTLSGGGGADIFVFGRGSGSDRILDFSLGQDRILLDNLRLVRLDSSLRWGEDTARNSLTNVDSEEWGLAISGLDEGELSLRFDDGSTVTVVLNPYSGPGLELDIIGDIIVAGDTTQPPATDDGGATSGYAPALQNDFYSTVSGQDISVSAPIGSLLLSFTSSTRFSTTEGGVTYAGGYTYEKKGPNEARLELYYDDGDRYSVDLTYKSATSFSVYFYTSDGTPVTADIQLAGSTTVTSTPVDASGYAPALQNDFYSTVSGQDISVSAPIGSLLLSFTSSTRFSTTEGGVTYAGGYTYEKKGPNEARLVLYYDDGDRYGVELTYKSATSFSVYFFTSDGTPVTADIQLAGSTTVTPTPVNASVDGTTGADNLDGSANADTINGLTGNDTLRGLAGNDILNGGAGTDTLNGGTGADHLQGGAGDDMLNGGPGADVLDGGAGEDTASYQDSARGVLVRLYDAGAVRFGDAEGDTLTGIEHLVGSQFNDTLAGDGGDNILKGEGGDDTLYGGPTGGDDMMYGGSGDDRLFGGRGDDVLTGGAGNDVMKGGAGADVLVADADDMDILYGGAGNDRFQFFPSDLGGGIIRDFADGEDLIDLSGFSGISSMSDLDVVSFGNNVRIELSSGTDYLTTIILSDFNSANLDNSDFMF